MSSKKKRVPESCGGSALPNQGEFCNSIGGYETHPNNTTGNPHSYRVRKDQPDSVRSVLVAAPQAADSALLGILTKYPSGGDGVSGESTAEGTEAVSPSEPVDPSYVSRSLERYLLLDAAQKLIFKDFNSDDPILPHRENANGRFAHRCAYCRRVLAYGASTVDLVYDTEEGRGGFAGLVTCGSVWACPVDAAIITEQRREELDQVIRLWEERGGKRAMLTLTLQHERGDSLEQVFGALKTAYQRLFYGRSFMHLKNVYGVVGRVVSTECNYGKHGFHPHYHILLLIEPEKYNEAGLETYIKQQWTGTLHGMGEYATWDNGADLSFGEHVRRDYLLKMGNEHVLEKGEGQWSIAHEITKGVEKVRSLTPLRLLAATITGGYRRGGLRLSAAQAGRLWLEYVAVYHGAKQLQYCGVALELRREIRQSSEVEELRQRDILAQLMQDAWTKITVAGRRGELREVVHTGNAAKLREYLLSLGIDVPVMQPGEQPVIHRRVYDLDADTMTDEILRPGDPGYEVARKAWAISRLRGGT